MNIFNHLLSILDAVTVSKKLILDIDLLNSASCFLLKLQNSSAAFNNIERYTKEHGTAPTLWGCKNPVCLRMVSCLLGSRDKKLKVISPFKLSIPRY